MFDVDLSYFFLKLKRYESITKPYPKNGEEEAIYGPEFYLIFTFG